MLSPEQSEAESFQAVQKIQRIGRQPTNIRFNLAQSGVSHFHVKTGNDRVGQK